MKDDFLVPKKWKSDIRKTFDINDKALSRKFDLYAENICKNTGLKNYLSEQQNNKCAWCGESLEDNTKGYSVIHHVDYDNFCTGPTYTWYKDGEEKEVPNCLGCSFKSMCTSNLYVVHSKCNKEINDVQLDKNSNKKDNKNNNNNNKKGQKSDKVIIDDKAIEDIKQHNIVPGAGRNLPNIYSEDSFIKVESYNGEIKVSEKEWYSYKEDSFTLFTKEYHEECLKVNYDHILMNEYLFSIISRSNRVGDVLCEHGEEYFTLDVLHKNRDSMIAFYPIYVPEYCSLYNHTSGSYEQNKVIDPLLLPFVYCEKFNGYVSDSDYFHNKYYEKPGEDLAHIYNLQCFEILPLMLPKGKVFEVEGIGDKKRGRLYICKEWYDDPDIKKYFDGLYINKSFTKKLLARPSVLEEYPWVKEYLNPSVV